LRYVQNVELNPATGVVAQWGFRANSIYDPDLTGTGHQPLGRDTFTEVYGKYIVVGSKITAKFLPTDGSFVYPSLVGIKLGDTSVMATTDASLIMEQGNSRFKVINSRTGATGGNAPTSVSLTFSGKKWFGWKDTADNLASFAAPASTNPTTLAYFTVYYGDIVGSADLTACNCVVTIEYIVKFLEPKEMAGS